MKGIFLKFQNMTNWTITDQPPNIKPDVLYVAVCKVPIHARCQYMQGANTCKFKL